VMYIRPANAAVQGNPIVAPTTRWLIFFDGGGGCQDADDCLWTRWCSGSGKAAPGITDRAGKMSSNGAIPAMRSPGGILKVPAPAGQEHFEQYNQVWVHYCSSDNGIGSDDKAAIAPVRQPIGGVVTYDIAFQGEAIVNAVIDTLLASTATRDPGVGYYDTCLPDLHDATEILIGGESAGAGIVRNHLDALRDWLVTEIPGATVRGVLDAGFTPDKTDSLRVEASGPNFVFYINGERMSQVSDPDYRDGEVGFYLETLDETLAHIHFDSLTIQKTEITQQLQPG